LSTWNVCLRKINDVTLALWGHVHRYERFCPVCNFTCGSTWKGFVVHAVIGMAGQDWQPIWEPRPDDPLFPQPDRSMYHGGEFKEKLTLITYNAGNQGMDRCMIWWRYWHLDKFSVVVTALVRKLETGLR